MYLQFICIFFLVLDPFFLNKFSRWITLYGYFINIFPGLPTEMRWDTWSGLMCGTPARTLRSSTNIPRAPSTVGCSCLATITDPSFWCYESASSGICSLVLSSCKPNERLPLSSLYEGASLSGRYVTHVTSSPPMRDD